MPKSLLLFFLGLMGALVVTVFAVVVIPESSGNDDQITELPDTIDEPLVTVIDPIRGNPDAKITIVEYGDFMCALCQSIEPELKAVIAAKPNQRRLVWKDAPNAAAHPESVPAAMAARCAQDQGAFWDFHDRLLGDRVTPTAERLLAVAEDLDLNINAFNTCMGSEAMRPVVDHTLQEALSLGVEGTPALYINGERYNGALTQAAIEAYISEL